jgi:putative DNA primase/helicase
LINAKKPEKNREAVRRYILQRWFETGRQPTLVVCQMEMQGWLEGKLPENISLGHYNAIAGLDEFRDVRLLILIGRTQPGPQSIEVLSATLSGSMPSINISQQSSFNWFRRVRRGIRMKDGTGVAILGDKHPDDFYESVRQLITEGELIQAVGRARGVNRSDETPLDIDLMFDTVLPMTIDEVAYWEKPSLFYSTAVEGVVLESPVDLMRVWPTIWPNEKAVSQYQRWHSFWVYPSRIPT